ELLRPPFLLEALVAGDLADGLLDLAADLLGDPFAALLSRVHHSLLRASRDGLDRISVRGPCRPRRRGDRRRKRPSSARVGVHETADARRGTGGLRRASPWRGAAPGAGSRTGVRSAVRAVSLV